ncbi:hypothetical protein WJX73_004243 [Symbiochloris irregularis]|uniref:Cilia- and flagella-associated protein 91 n=1 Tax=Symbiochloris irregularis TaxID=706552 RepID=A0AAW1NZP9_9CHLO
MSRTHVLREAGPVFEPLAVIRTTTDTVLTQQQLITACTIRPRVPTPVYDARAGISGRQRLLYTRQNHAVEAFYQLDEDQYTTDSEEDDLHRRQFSSLGTQTAMVERSSQTSFHDLELKPHVPHGSREVDKLRKAQMTEAQRVADVCSRAAGHEQAKRDFEASLPPVTDSASARLQLQALGNWEAASWHEREAEIARRQQDKAALLVEALKLREAQMDEEKWARLEALRVKRMALAQDAAERMDEYARHVQPAAQHSQWGMMTEHPHRTPAALLAGPQGSNFATRQRRRALMVTRKVLQAAGAVQAAVDDLGSTQRSMQRSARDKAPSMLAQQTREMQQHKAHLEYLSRILEMDGHD